MTFQEIILNLQKFWSDRGCAIVQPYDIEVGAGTFNPATFLRCLGPEPWNVAYVEPCRRPTDGRYGENPYRLGAYYQFQVMLKPAPTNVLPLYLESLKYLGIDPTKHDLRFVEDDWESPTLGASGLGWEVWWNGAEITQFTYFQQMGSLELDPICAELTYGLERIALYLQDVDSFFDIRWTGDLTYGDVYHQNEVEFSKYNFEFANTEMLFDLFATYEKEAFACLDQGLVLPAADHVLKCSHTFNLLDARGVISVTERVGYIERVRRMARRTAKAFVDQRAEMDHPLLKTIDPKIEKPIEISTPKNFNETESLLFEIGTEEIPASYISPALRQLEKIAKKDLIENRLEFGEIKVLGTPRRSVLSISELQTQQADQTTEIVGPPKRIAFDSDGNPTKSAIGFAKSQGGSVEDLRVAETDRGEYIALTKTEKGRNTSEILADLLPKWIRLINFPKTMRWDNLRFARPIRWLVALLGSEIINFQLDTLRSDRKTFGHRSLNSEAIEIEIADLDDYIEKMRSVNVIVNQRIRCAEIQKMLTEILKAENCSTEIDQTLLDEVNFLVENPQAIVGTFDEKHLDLPIEVLTTYMKKHQRYFPILRSDGKPIAKFIAISNGTDGNFDSIRHGNERVLRSRFEDAEFYYDEDQRSTLAEKVDRLKNVVFQIKLGTLFAKTKRIEKLAKSIAEDLELDPDQISTAQRSAQLCKADLTTQMVIGFPTLQGTMGRYYAENSGEIDPVAIAIEEHYKPISADSPTPKSIAGAVVSIADKIDTIIGYFGINERPTGSQDQYSLRRHAIGILRILRDRRWNLPIETLIKNAIENYEISLTDDTAIAVLDFFRGRFEVLLGDLDFQHDEISAVLAVGDLNVREIEDRLKVLVDFRKSENFDRVYPALNRILRILKTEIKTEIQPDLFENSAEQDLYRFVSEDLSDLLISDYEKLIEKLSDGQKIIDRFFDEVLVMAEDLTIRENRLALLSVIARKILEIADLRKLVE